VTRHFTQKNLRFYLTAAAPCPYLPGRKERKVFTSLDGLDARPLNDALTHAGFRRSQNIAYRPACEGCDSCISVRIPVSRFTMGKRWRRVLAQNEDLARRRTPPEATEDQFWLLRRYLNARHAHGGMSEMTLLDYAAMVEETAVRSHIVEYRSTAPGHSYGDLVAAALVDVLKDGLSLVYSFYEPRAAERSLGSFIILDHVIQALGAELDYVYLGYWVPGSAKMEYKKNFQPLELLRGGAWRPYESVMERRGDAPPGGDGADGSQDPS
jgi:arginine-tRNA-protein transferase